MKNETQRAFFDHIGNALSNAAEKQLHPGLVVTMPLEWDSEVGEYRVADMVYHKTADSIAYGLEPPEADLLVLDALECAVRKHRRAIEREMRSRSVQRLPKPNL